jgi:serine/threonine-protein kinase
MGVVYRARQASLNRDVAIKLIGNADEVAPETQARFQAEAEVLARLRHPAVVQVHDAGVRDGRMYLVLELVGGGSLDQHIRGAPWEPASAAALVAKLGRAIQACHDCGVLHRDLKPANVLLTPEGEPKIADFGLAKCLDKSRLTASGAILGTPAYMAPEQAGGSAACIGPATDVYGLGAILYELLTGRPPFGGATPLDVLQRVVAGEPARPSVVRPGLPLQLETICLKCLQKDPARRYASALELALDLERFLRGEPIQGRLPSWLVRASRWAARHQALTTALVCITTQSLLYWLWSSLNPTLRVVYGSFVLGGLTHTLSAAGAAWFVIRPAGRPRSRLFRVVLLIAVAVASLVALDFALHPAFVRWLNRQDRGGILFAAAAYAILIDGPIKGLITGLLCLAVGAGVRRAIGGSWMATLAGTLIGFWVGVAGATAAVAVSSLDPAKDAFILLVPIVLGITLVGMLTGGVIGARWSRQTRPPNPPRQPTEAAATVSESVGSIKAAPAAEP